jgi:NAD(P)-dependent dehydrogenase (short-subunit alcohol dehydrogenase family)
MPNPLSTNLKGKTAVVTGATGGIGKEIARGLARMGAQVIIGARDSARGEAARREITAETGNDAVFVLPLDVSSVESVRRFAAALRARNPRLNILVNNAGAWFSDRKETTEGHEMTFATNVLGPYVLTHALVDLLRAGAPARVVNVVSSLSANYDVSDLEYRKRKWDGFKAYGQSKQALRILTGALARKLEGSGVTVNDAAPGFVKSGFNRNAHGLMAMMINFSARLMAVSPEEGADTPLWVASAPELEGITGKYFEKRKEGDAKFRDQAVAAELERALSAAVAQTRAVA